MKPIQTRYAGCHFRSRLEARWAVFFDTAGIRWEYEPQGFELPSGKKYLPDFYLPDVQRWIEIKGDPGPSKSDYPKLVEFGVEQFAKRGENFTIISGAVPQRGPIPALSFTMLPYGASPFVPKVWNRGGWFLSEDLPNLAAVLKAEDIHPELKVGMSNEDRTNYKRPNGTVMFSFFESVWFPPIDGDDLNDALTAARSARFERQGA